MGLIDRAKDAAQRGIGEGKEKVEEVKLNRKQKELAEELGHAVYRQRTGHGGDADVERLVGEMRAVASQLEALRD